MTIKTIVFDEVPETDGADILLFCRGTVDGESVSLISEALNGGECGAVVLRTCPIQMPAYIDPITMDINCASFDGFAVLKKAYDATGGLDMALGEAAATDLVWRLRALGYAVKYLPKAEVMLEQNAEISYADKLIQCFLMRCKHGSFRDICQGKILVLKAMRHPDVYGVARGELIKKYFGVLFKCFARFLKRSGCKPFAEFAGVGYSLLRGKYEVQKPLDTPFVSVIVRTYKRTETLRKTLESLRHQTYRNFEIVVIEDSEPLSDAMINRDFGDLDITYKAMGKNTGRAAAANEGFDIAKGEYLNLLDDDDYLLPEHIELAVASAEKNAAGIVFMRGIALETEALSLTPYKFTVRKKRLMDFPHVDVFSMARQCLTPDNGVLFKKSLLKAAGGVRQELGAHEDWSLWLRLMAAGSWVVVPFATCCFVVSAQSAKEDARLAGYALYDDMLLDDDRLKYKITAAELKGFYENTIHDFMYLKQLGVLDDYLEKEYKKIINKKGKV